MPKSKEGFPTQVYICPGVHQCPGGTFSTAPATDSKELKELLDAGYSLTLPAACGDEDTEDNTPPNRDEAKAKAKELEIKHPKNITTEKLIDLINAKLAEK